MIDEANELDFVEWVQSWGTGWESFMKLISELGNPLWYVLVVAVVYWCINPRVGLRFGLFIFLSGAINEPLKQLAGSARPFWLSREVVTFGPGSNAFGMPSGHSQVGSIAWAYLIGSFGRRWIPAGLAVAVLIGVSRIYLGQHFPSQVLAGWTVGALLFYAMFRLENRFLAWFTTKPTTTQFALVGAAAAALLLAGATAISLRSGWDVPVDWIANAEGRLEDDEQLEPVDGSAIAAGVGAFAGAALGAVLANAQNAIRSAPNLSKRLLRLPVGTVVVVLSVAALSALLALPGLNSDARPMELVREFAFTFAIFGSIIGLAPIAFTRLSLTPELPEPTMQSKAERRDDPNLR